MAPAPARKDQPACACTTRLIAALPTSLLPSCPADKDLFSEFYRKKLARRLLHSTSGASSVPVGSVLLRSMPRCGQLLWTSELGLQPAQQAA